MIQRQEVLQEAWDQYKGETSATGDAYLAGWMKARASALKAAGMDPIWEN